MREYFFTIITLAKTLTRRYFRDRTAIFFTIAFPLIFLVIFGSLFGRNNVSFNTEIINQSNYSFSKVFISDLQKTNLFKLKNATSLSDAEKDLNKAQTDAILVLPPDFGKPNTSGIPSGTINVYYDTSDLQTAQAISSTANGILQGVNSSLTKYVPPIGVKTISTNSVGESYFDYIFSGMLGFTIIVITLLGPTRSIPVFKKQGILRRLHTTPISSAQYMLASMLSNIVIALISIGVMFLVGLHFYHLDMTGSYLTLAVFAIISIAMMFGFGLSIGGWAKSEDQAAPITNIISFPMMFLSGTFFPTYLMPLWLQSVSRFLPLTPVISGLRYIISENKSLLQLGPELGLIAVWAVVIYIVAFNVFKWE